MFFSKISSQNNKSSGFTLVELLVAIAITGIVISVAGFGLVNILQANKKAEATTERRIDLNRALDYIADDIRESSSISTTFPTGWKDSCYSEILFLTKPGGNQVAYGLRSKTCNSYTSPWRGPKIIYRFRASGSTGEPLVDAISDTSIECSGSGTTSGSEGFKANIDGRKVKICLKGKVSDSETYSVETNAFARSSP